MEFHPLRLRSGLRQNRASFLANAARNWVVCNFMVWLSAIPSIETSDDIAAVLEAPRHPDGEPSDIKRLCERVHRSFVLGILRSLRKDSAASG